jgi:DNA repair exonuclease SbcCD ATPase subunit
MDDVECIRLEAEAVKNSSTETIRELEAKYSRAIEERHQLQQQASETGERVKLLEIEIETLQVAEKRTLESTERIRRLEAEIEDLRTAGAEKLRSAEQVFEQRLQTAREELLQEVSKGQKRVTQLETEIEDLQTVQKQALQSAEGAFLQKLGESDQKVQELEAKRSEHLAESQKLVSECQKLVAELSQKTISIDELKRASAEADGRAQQATLRLSELEQQLQKADADADGLRTIASAQAAGLDEAKVQAQDAMAQLEDAKRTVEEEWVFLGRGAPMTVLDTSLLFLHLQTLAGPAVAWRIG